MNNYKSVHLPLIPSDRFEFSPLMSRTTSTHRGSSSWGPPPVGGFFACPRIFNAFDFKSNHFFFTCCLLLTVLELRAFTLAVTFSQHLVFFFEVMEEPSKAENSMCLSSLTFSSKTRTSTSEKFTTLSRFLTHAMLLCRLLCASTGKTRKCRT